MKYPTLAEVEAADHEQICRWWRFLPSPGFRPKYAVQETVMELQVMDRIVIRFKQLGGMTPELSKRIGWDN